jgi:DNA-binding XRE family transcriptional regulator
MTPDELRDRRKALGLSQSGLGRALGISPNTVARWERGEQRLGNPSLVRLALDGLAHAAAVPDAATGAHDRGSANLPAPTSSLIGRHAEIHMLRRLCARRRLVTLTGTAGVGKTRLAQEIASQLAARHGDRTVLVELAPLSEPAQVVRKVAACLQVPERPGYSLTETLAAALETEHVRLVWTIASISSTPAPDSSHGYCGSALTCKSLPLAERRLESTVSSSLACRRSD